MHPLREVWREATPVQRGDVPPGLHGALDAVHEVADGLTLPDVLTFPQYAVTGVDQLDEVTPVRHLTELQAIPATKMGEDEDGVLKKSRRKFE